MPTPFHSALLSHVAEFNALDWVVVFLVTWSVVVAFSRGLIRELFGLAGTILGLLLACWNYPQLASRLARWVSTPLTANTAAFMLIFVGTLIVCTLLGRIVRGGAHSVGLGFLDRLSGAAFGLLRGALLALGVVVTAMTLLSSAPLTGNSRLAPYFLAAAREVSFVVPQDLQKRITSSIDGIRHLARR